jgi:hypothetical protein
MAATIAGSTYTFLDTQPRGYQEADTQKGFTARKWIVSGYLTESEWTGMVAAYDSWRNARITDPDSLISKTVGTTVSFSTDEPPAVSGVACWYLKAPQAVRQGSLWLASVELVDATQALDVAIRSEQKKEEDKTAKTEELELGTVTLGTTVLTLTQPMGAFMDEPSLNLTAQGTHYVSGATGITKTRDIQGYTDLNGWMAIRQWYEQVVTSVPNKGEWFPITPPKSTAESIIVDGLTTVRYNVTIRTVLVR